jgi:hypothetical protein
MAPTLASPTLFFSVLTTLCARTAVRMVQRLELQQSGKSSFLLLALSIPIQN